MDYLRGSPAPLVLDVGANQGQSVFRFKKLLPDAIVHSFEPSPHMFEGLRANAGGLDNVTLVNSAVGSAEGTSILLENRHSVLSSLLRPDSSTQATIIAQTPVPITTVDAYCREHSIPHIDLLKTDTQGYELEVLRGCADLFAKNRIKLIYLEVIFHGQYEDVPPFDVVYRFLTDRGFKLVSIYSFVVSDRLASWADCLFVNPTFEGERPSGEVTRGAERTGRVASRGSTCRR